MSLELLIVSAIGAAAAVHVCSEDGPIPVRAVPGPPVWATDLPRSEASPPVNRGHKLPADRSIVNGSHEVLHSVMRESGDRQHQVAQRCTRRLDLDFDVVPQTIEAIHQFAFGQVGEVAT